MNILDNKFYFWLLMGIILIVYLTGLNNVIYGIDGKIYASISAEMSESSNWLEVYSKGEDYLDKPPLLFWISALSIKLFGVSPFAYRLPSLLFTLLGLFSTYKLGSLLYNDKVGKLASLIYFSSIAIALANQDVRTDNILASSVIFSLWQLIAYIKLHKWYYFIGGFFGIALAMLSKGPIGIMIPVLAILTHSVLTKNYKILFKWEWLLGILLTFIFISPMVWGLYTQFDAQMPDKEFHLASGKIVSNYSGLKFYFWDQSFGRILGGNEEGWKNDSTVFFFVHTYLWSFIPWSIIGILAFIKKIKENRTSKEKEWFVLGAIILPFIAFSLSSFKLPHYILPLIPFMAILTANYLLAEKKQIFNKTIFGVQLGLSIILLMIIGFLLFYIFPGHYFYITLYVIVGPAILFFFFIKKIPLTNKVIFSGIICISLGLLMFNRIYIPELSKYDHTKIGSDIIKTRNINNVYANVADPDILNFYINKTNKRLYHHIKLEDIANKNNCLWVADYPLEKIESKVEIKEIIPLKGKSITKVNLNFLLSPDKEEFLTTQYLIFI